ncbi:TetR family transcriptional regulator [Pseudonocardia yuanmonensis]|uniref:TetR family transcriptional regulator n=1 Tax=Pseudonocardia yuanmonensis TaxID=1095914 RepID=UPI0031E7BA89
MSPVTPRRGRSAAGRAEVRRDLVTAAVDLFTAQGYDDTTVDDIAAAAGVGRRTFFRYFKGKEDAVSPDHERGLARIAEVFATAHPTEPLVSVVLRAGETVFDLYLSDPETARKRFALVHEVPALRDREAAMVHRYRRLFTKELAARLTDVDDGDLRAAVTGAAVVAAHNQALRRWLADGGTSDGTEACRAYFRRVAAMLPLEQAPDLEQVARRLERAARSLERRTN